MGSIVVRAAVQLTTHRRVLMVWLGRFRRAQHLIKYVVDICGQSSFLGSLKQTPMVATWFFSQSKAADQKSGTIFKIFKNFHASTISSKRKVCFFDQIRFQIILSAFERTFQSIIWSRMCSYLVQSKILCKKAIYSKKQQDIHHT